MAKPAYATRALQGINNSHNRPKDFYVPRGNLTQPGIRPSRGNEADVITGSVRLPQGPVDKKRLSRRQTKQARRQVDAGEPRQPHHLPQWREVIS